MKTIFFDVDTQNDFMNEDGALYVPGAEEIKPILGKISAYARKHNYPIMGSVDNHIEIDSELQRNGGPFPDHCMAGTYGQEKIKETKLIRGVYAIGFGDAIAIDSSLLPLDISDLIKKHLDAGGEFFFQKQSYDVFTNEYLNNSIDSLGIERAIVYGVATDYCVKAAAIGMSVRGIQVYVLEDAIRGANPETTEEALKEMKKSGVKFIQFGDLEKIIGGD